MGLPPYGNVRRRPPQVKMSIGPGRGSLGPNSPSAAVEKPSARS